MSWSLNAQIEINQFQSDCYAINIKQKKISTSLFVWQSFVDSLRLNRSYHNMLSFASDITEITCKNICTVISRHYPPVSHECKIQIATKEQWFHLIDKMEKEIQARIASSNEEIHQKCNYIWVWTCVFLAYFALGVICTIFHENFWAKIFLPLFYPFYQERMIVLVISVAFMITFIVSFAYVYYDIPTCDSVVISLNNLGKIMTTFMLYGDITKHMTDSKEEMKCSCGIWSVTSWKLFCSMVDACVKHD